MQHSGSGTPRRPFHKGKSKGFGGDHGQEDGTQQQHSGGWYHKGYEGGKGHYKGKQENKGHHFGEKGQEKGNNWYDNNKSFGGGKHKSSNFHNAFHDKVNNSSSTSSWNKSGGNEYGHHGGKHQGFGGAGGMEKGGKEGKEGSWRPHTNAWNNENGGPQHAFGKDHHQQGGHKGGYDNNSSYQHYKQNYHQNNQDNRHGEHQPKRRFFRRCIDYNSTVVNFLEHWNEGEHVKRNLGCNYTFAKDMMPAFATPYSPYDSICSRYVYSAVNKVRSAVNTVTFSPNGRRVITGSHTGELTIWNAQQFHFENNMQAHTAAVRALTWSPVEDILLSGDHLGQIKLWDQNFYNSQNLQAHKDSLREISMAPTGQKFCTCADDSSAKVWDFKTLQEERQFAGHGWDVKCCSWHPSKGLIATGSKDCQIKLWDPRASEAITTIHAHKNMVTRVKWSSEGNWLISGGRDTTIGLMDIRTMGVRKHFKGHSREVTALCWHPEFETIFCSGGFDGSLIYWDLFQEKPCEFIQQAHDATIWSIAWHPFGHLVASGSHDNCCRFWSRGRPGDRNTKELVPKREHRFGFDKARDEKNKHGGEEEAELGELPKPTCLPDKILTCGIFASMEEESARKRVKVDEDKVTGAQDPQHDPDPKEPLNHNHVTGEDLLTMEGSGIVPDEDSGIVPEINGQTNITHGVTEADPENDGGVDAEVGESCPSSLGMPGLLGMTSLSSRRSSTTACVPKASSVLKRVPKPPPPVPPPTYVPGPPPNLFVPPTEEYDTCGNDYLT